MITKKDNMTQSNDYIYKHIYIYFKLDFPSSLYMPHAMETQRLNSSSGH